MIGAGRGQNTEVSPILCHVVVRWDITVKLIHGVVRCDKALKSIMGYF